MQSNYITYYRTFPSDSLLGGWKTQKVTRKARNRKVTHAQRFFTTDRCWSLGVLLGTVLGSLYLQNLGKTTIQLIHQASAQEISLSASQPELSEGEAAKITDAGQASTATPSASLSEKQQILMYIVEKFGDRSHQAIAMLAKCENSELNPYATNHNRNGTIDRGVFQINSIHGGDEMYDWKINIDKAYEIYSAHNNTFYAWTCGSVAGDKTYVDTMRSK